MRLHTKSWPRRNLKLSLLAILLLLPAVAAHAEKSRDLIVVMDISSSMVELFDDAKVEAKKFISTAQVGDRVTVITFGRRAYLLERTRIKSSYNIAKILSEIEELTPTEFSTNLPSAMQRGLEEMEQFYKEDPDAERTMLWLSDDKSNPPKDIPNLITFASLKEQKTGRLPDHKWFEFEAPIETGVESDVKWFVDWAKRNNMLLKATLVDGNLGIISSSKAERKFQVNFEPDSAGVWGTSFSVVAEATDEERGNFSATIPVSPPVVVCDGSPWQETFRISLPDRPGNYVIRVSFVLPTDKLLEISPPQLTLQGTVKPENRLDKKSDRIAAIEKTFASDYQRTMNRRARADKGFAREIRGDLVGDAIQAFSTRTTLVFGPIVSGGQYRETASLTSTQNVPVDSIYMKSTLDLPEGINLQPAFRMADGQLFADLCLTVAEDMEPQNGWEIQGVISFLSKVEKAKIKPSAIPVRLYSKADLSAWGKRTVVVGATYEKVGYYLGSAKDLLAKAAKVLLIIAPLWVFYHLIKKYFFATTELIGMLEIARNPTNRKLKYFNLQRVGKLKRKDALTIGSSAKADVVLPHSSVSEMHAKISTTKIDQSVIIFVQPLGNNHIKVNDVVYGRQKEIGDGDKLMIGDFLFVYKRPEVYRETIVTFTNGNALRGTLISWDIDAPKFEFLPIKAPSLHAKMVIEFSQLKTVSFVRKVARFSKERFLGSSKPIGSPVQIFFKDGDLLEGYMMGEVNDWSKRFYLIPREREAIALILVERTAVDSIVKRDAFKEPFFHLRRVFRGITANTSL